VLVLLPLVHRPLGRVFGVHLWIEVWVVDVHLVGPNPQNRAVLFVQPFDLEGELAASTDKKASSGPGKLARGW
jgi:hypothetical protein